MIQPDQTTFNIADVLGVAIFDLNGLPREYFVTEEEPSIHWVQLVFQALGLRSLLASSLALEGFQQIVIGLEARTAVVVKRQQDYIALQLEGQFTLDQEADQASLMALIDRLDLETLNQHSHFKAA
ncbi:MAG: hypothetical protein AAGE59_17300 [Cyanobacteria bacterium P01_F01_bin.86]